MITSRQCRSGRLGCLLFLLFAPVLTAATVTWNLSNGVFSDGGTVTGSFTVDVDTQTASTWSLAVAGGNTGTFSPRTYTPANSSFTFFPSQDTYLFSDTSTFPSRDLRIGPFNTPLTDAGGTVTTVPSNFGNTECFNCAPFRSLTATLTSTPADLTVNSTHTGIFLRGQTGATYTITVNNIQADGPSIGTVTATDTLPSGMTATSITGTGWTCGLATLTCTRSDTLNGSSSYPPITIVLDVGAGAASNSVNSVVVSGGGETNTGNDSGTDPTQVNDPPDLIVSKMHAGNFTQGQAGAAYAITVTNAGLGPTLSAVSVVDMLPASLSIVNLMGNGWTCNSGTIMCTRADTLAGGASYPPITVVVNVAANASNNLVNSVMVSGGSELNTSNDSASDPTTVIQVADLTLTKTHPASFTRGQSGAYTLIVNNVGPGPTAGAVTVTDAIPSGLTIAAMNGAGWTCNAAMASCTRSDVLGINSSYAPITVTVNVAATSPLNITNSASVSGGGELNLANDSASDPTSVNPALTIVTPIPTALSGSTYSPTLSATGGVAPYAWSAAGLPSWLSINTDGTLSGSPPGNFYGTVPLTLTVTDAVGDSTTMTVQLTVQLPVLRVLQASFTATAGLTFTGAVNATGGLKPYTWSAGGLPPWLSIYSFGEITGIPPLYGSAGSYILPIVVTDAASNSASASLTLTVNPAPITITPQSLSHAVVGFPYQVTFSASGGSGKYTWSALGLPSGFSLTSSGVLSGTAPPGLLGTYTFSINATDSANASANVNLTLQVDPAPVVITTLANLPAATETIPYTTALSATGGVPPYRWSATGIPSWLHLNTNGSLSGTPPIGTAGILRFNVSLNDSSTETALATFQIVISSANSILGIDTQSKLPAAKVGVPYNESLSAHGGKPPYLWSETGIAPGLSLSSSGVISGTPTAALVATFTGQVNDTAGASAFRAFGLSVVSPGLSIRTPAMLAQGVIGVPYMQLLSASGGGQQLTWSLTNGSLPQGVTLSASGILMGTPQGTGNFVFTVSVTDSSGLRTQVANPNSTSQTFQIDVRPSGTELIFSVGSLPFLAVTGGSAPRSQVISIITTSPAPVPFTVTTSDPWVQVTPSSGMTPGNVTVSVDQTNLLSGTYSTNIGFTTPGNPPQLVGVTLNVSSALPALAASPDSIQISNLARSSNLRTGPVFVQNTGPGYLSFNATVLDAPWLSLDQTGSVIAPNQTDTLTFSANTDALGPGVYRGRIELASNNGFADIPVTLTVTTQNRLILSSAGTLLEARQGAGISGPATQSLNILASEDTPLNWTAQLIGSSSFLKLSTGSGVSTNAAPGTVSYQVDSSGLDVGSYYARIEVTSPDAANSPQEFVVVLNVMPPATPPTPNPSPAGLLFASPANGASEQPVTVFTSSSTPVTFQAAASTESGSPWLSVAPLSGNISSQSPAQLTVSVLPSGLAPGVYRGTINVAQGNLAVPGINVTLIVTTSTANTIGMATAKAVAGCSPDSLVMTYTGLVNEFSTPAAWPGVIAITLSDNCGGTVKNGEVVASFSNGDPPLQLSLSDPATASYSATWVPQNSGSQVTISALATAPGLQSGTATLIGTVAPNVAPVINKNGILNGLYPQMGAALAPGTIVQIYGSGLAASSVTSDQLPLPTTMLGTSILVGGMPAPLLYISDTQINAQIPFELVPGHQYYAIVSVGDSYTLPQPIQVAQVAPGVARLADGSVIAQHRDSSLVSESSPAQPGEYLVAYLVGMGLTDVQVTDGTASPSNPPARASVVAGVTLNGERVNVAFAGLTPGLVGLYQINFQVPKDASSGDLVLQVTQQGVAANAGKIVVAK